MHCKCTAYTLYVLLSGGGRVATAGHTVPALARPCGEEKRRRSGGGGGGGCGGSLATSGAHHPRIHRRIVPPRGHPHPHSCRRPHSFAASRRLGPRPAHDSRTVRRVQYDQWSLRRGPLRLPRGLDGLELRHLPCRRHLLLGRRGRVRRARHADGGRRLPVRPRPNRSWLHGAGPHASRGHVGHGAAPYRGCRRGDAQQPGLARRPHAAQRQHRRPHQRALAALYAGAHPPTLP